MATELVYDDTYTGPRWTYGLSHRPLAAFAVPGGWIIQSDRADPAYRYGTVDYPRALSDTEVASYELVPVGGAAGAALDQPTGECPYCGADLAVDEDCDCRIACPCGGNAPRCRACDVAGTTPAACARCEAALATETACVADRGDVLCGDCFLGYLDALGNANALLDRFLASDPCDRTYDVTITLPLKSADYGPWARTPEVATELVWAMIRADADWPDTDLIAVSLTVRD